MRRLLHRLGYRLAALNDTDTLEPLLYRLLKAQGRVVFVQIGANDGRQGDPLHRFLCANHAHVRGLVVEPVSDLFAELVTTYRRYPQITPVNLAIHNTADEMIMWRVDPALRDRVPRWAQGIASFDADHHKRTHLPRAYIRPERVRCTTLARLMRDHGITDLDVLQIDAEGYDAEIVRGVDFDRVKPAVIHFEHGLPHGVMSAGTLEGLLDRLRDQDYEFTLSGYDVTAYQRRLFLPGTHCLRPSTPHPDGMLGPDRAFAAR